jgi:hypothetical protein
MNHIVILDTNAGELEKILSGTKSMIIKEFDPAQTTNPPVCPGDGLYFLRNRDERVLQVKATVVRVQTSVGNVDEDLSHTLKEMQPRLQLTEDQHIYWSARSQVLLVEFNNAHKINMINVGLNEDIDKSGWITFKEFNLAA